MNDVSEIGNVDFRDLGMRIRQQRIKLDWTQAELAKRIGVTGSFIGPHRTGGEGALVGDCSAAERRPWSNDGLACIWNKAKV